jgi:hypothetical protein
MGWFNKKETPESLERKFPDYFKMFENSIMGFIFKFHDNDGNDITFKENTESRNVLLKRNFERIELIKYDKMNNVVFRNQKKVFRADDDKDVIKAIHELYFKEMPQ